MSPGKSPNAVSPGASPNVKFVDVSKDFGTFENTIKKEEEQAKKTLETNLAQSLGNKKVVARASKGSVGQTEQDYTIDVVEVSVSNMSEKFYIILKGTDDKEYYINTQFKVKVLGNAEPKKGSSKQTPPQPEQTRPNGKGQVGGIKYPQTMGLSSTSPTT